MPSTLKDFVMYRGLAWKGLQAMAVSASGEAVNITGSTALLQARKAAGKELAFELPVVIGEAVGQILVPKVAATETAALPVGKFVYDCILIGDDGEPWPPVMHGSITVKDSISQPS